MVNVHAEFIFHYVNSSNCFILLVFYALQSKLKFYGRNSWPVRIFVTLIAYSDSASPIYSGCNLVIFNPGRNILNVQKRCSSNRLCTHWYLTSCWYLLLTSSYQKFIRYQLLFSQIMDNIVSVLNRRLILSCFINVCWNSTVIYITMNLRMLLMALSFGWTSDTGYKLRTIQDCKLKIESLSCYLKY